MLGATLRRYEIYENVKFQSSPSLGAGSNTTCNIRTIHRCMFQSSPSLGAGSNAVYFAANPSEFQFQSSPSLGAGSNFVASPKSIMVRVFQSSPSLGAGSNGPACEARVCCPVSILSQLRCWEQQAGGPGHTRRARVSILSQLRCWEQHRALHTQHSLTLFQSSPSLGAGSNICPVCGYPMDKAVSILSQLRCWEQRDAK